MASGLACIVDERCSAHLVVDGVNGYTVRGGDVEAYYRLAKRLCNGAEGAALRKQLGDEGRSAPPPIPSRDACADHIAAATALRLHLRDRPLTVRLCACPGRALERYDVRANTQEMVEHYLMRVSAARCASGAFSMNSFLFSILSEIVQLGFFWGAMLINKVLSLTFYIIGV